MTPEAALDELRSHSDAQKAAEMAAYHKAPRDYIGVANPVIDAACKVWRADITIEERVALASGLWETDVHEARVAAGKLLTQARIRPDDGAWVLIESWVPQFDAWAIADHASIAGQKRLIADPTRLNAVEAWTDSPHMWTRRAALVMTLPWTKMKNPKPDDIQVRERILGWAGKYASQKHGFIQKAVSWWLRELSKHDPDRVRAFLEEYGGVMKPFAVKDASRKLPPQ